MADKPTASLVFDMKMVKQMYDHTMACKRHRLTFDQQFDLYGDEGGSGDLPKDAEHACADGRLPKGLLFVHDQGIYLMSSGFPRLTVNGEPDAEQVICYAEGHDPSTNPSWHQDASRAVGGDDFAMAISHDIIEELFKVLPDADKMMIDVFSLGRDEDGDNREFGFSASGLAPPANNSGPQPA